MQWLIDYGSVVAFLIFSLGVVFQIKKTITAKSVRDISVTEVLFRALASFLIMFKVVNLKDPYLMTGSILFCCVFVIYVVLVIKTAIGEK